MRIPPRENRPDPVGVSPAGGHAPPPRGICLVLGTLLLGTIALQVVARGPLVQSLWGFHQYAYLPGWSAIATWVGLGGSGMLVLLGRARGLERAVERAGGVFEAHPRRVTLILAVVSGALFWMLRSHQTVLGDGWPLLSDLVKGQQFHPRQPLTAWLQQRLLQGALALTGRAPHEADPALAMLAVAAGSVACGVSFTLVASAWGRFSVRPRAVARATAPSPANAAPRAAPQEGTIALLVTLVLLAQGYSVLFCGYIENYTFPALMLGVFLFLGAMLLADRVRLLLPLVAYVVLLALHLSMVTVAPVLLVLLVHGLRRSPRRALVDLAIGAGIGIALHMGVARLSPGYSVWTELRNLRAQTQTLAGGENPLAYMFSRQHLRDFVNCQHLIAPLGAALLLPVSLMVARRRAVPPAMWLFVGGAAWLMLAASFIMPDPTLGYARDWDLFAPPGIAFAMAAVFGLTSCVRDRRVLVQLLLAGLLLSWMHTAPWIAINHSEQRSVTRLADLPLGDGRAEVAVGFWYLRNERPEQARPWFERAAAVAPRNVNAHQMLGFLHLQAGHPDSAAASFAAALRIRPDKLEFHAYRTEALMRAGRYKEALRHLDLLCASQPENYHHWLQRGLALEGLQHDDEAREAFQRALLAAEGEWRAGRRSYQQGLDRGVILLHLGRTDEGIAALEEALVLSPSSESALNQVVSLMIGAGRPDAARPHVQRLLELDPQHPRAAQMREWLAQPPAP